MFVKLLVALGHRLELFEALQLHGVASAPELAMRMGLDEGSISEWMNAMVEAGCLERDPNGFRFGILGSSSVPRSTKFAGRAVLEFRSPE